jgi:cytochrome c-type biogenesis protein CcsB
MNIFEIESFFGNSSFFFLFLSMVLYWIQLIFNLKFFNFGRLCMICANFSLLSLLVLRWKESGHFPLSNLYESLMFLSWCFSSFHLILENVEFLAPRKQNNFLNLLSFHLPYPTDKRSEPMPRGQVHGQTNQQYKPSLFAAFTSPPALFTNAFATFSLPSEMQHSSALVPALQSNWLMMHVTVMILSYSALICGSLLSIAFLIFSQNLDMGFLSKKDQSFTKFMNSSSSTFQQNEFQASSGFANPASPSWQDQQLIDLRSNSVGSAISLENSLATKDIFIDEIQISKNQNQTKFETHTANISTKQKFAEKLDNLSYRILGIGFPLLTIGILSGAVWANEAWGSYWSWDPKETWALATWFVFAIYLHTRLTKGWSGKKPAIIASLGFVTVWICFLGVNLLGEGLHSYGFFK